MNENKKSFVLLMAVNFKNIFGQTDSDNIGTAVEELVGQAIRQRKSHERRWYDNNFFDDGLHFRSISRKTGKVLDHANRNNAYVERAIPRASRQIRGVANLLFAAEPYPVIYPQRITVEKFMENGQLNQQAYQQAQYQTKDIARKQGIWLTTEWEELGLNLKLLDMILLAAKNSVSYLQIYSDTDKQKLCTDIFDSFDVVVFGDKREIDDLPFMTKVAPMEIMKVQSNELFDPKMAAKVTADNKYATSEIKEAYMRARFGSKIGEKDQATVLVKETFMQEILSKDNWKEALKNADQTGAIEGKSQGDQIMRHVFSAGGITLGDEYINYDKYPFAEFRFEPGPLYQVPFIERFIPQNKSVDVIVTRLEKWINAMIVGVYQKRKGENFQVSNFPGGQMIEYETTPLTQMNMATAGNTPFQMINLLDKYIEEQGAATAALGQIPNGVKANAAIENIQQQEYANLKTPTLMLAQTIKRIAELMLERADKDFLQPKEVESLKDGSPNYFEVIGQRGYKLSEQVGKPLPADIVPIAKDVKVRIEIEPGLGLTMDGQKQSMESILDYVIKINTEVPGTIPPEALQMMIKRFLETFGYGSTEELMEAMENGRSQGQMSDQDIMKMKVALLQTLQDGGLVGPQADQKMVDSTKVGVLESLKESGILDKLNTPKLAGAPQKVSESITYKDAPEDIRRQIEVQAGLQPSTQETISPLESDQVNKHASAVKSIADAVRPAPQQAKAPEKK